jgi:hypothetical protein
MKTRDTTPPKSAEPPGRDPETTLDLMKALEGAAIVMEEPAAAPGQPTEPPPSYNPYDTGAGKTGRKC